MRTRQLLAAFSLVAVALMLVGCAPSATKSGPTRFTTLRMAHVDADVSLDPAAQLFMNRVKQLSKGQLRIRLVGECCTRENTNAKQLVKGVAVGDFDLGWAWTRGLEDLNVTTFQGLSAPRLIDSYALEKSVLAGGFEPSILPGLSSVGVKGIALEPGTLRRPIEAKTPLLDVGDWPNTTFWSNKSGIANATVTALGATSTQVRNDDRDSGLAAGTINGAENSVAWEASTQHVQDPVISINEALWARIDVLIANPLRLNKLTPKQRVWLTEAAHYTTGQTDAVAALDKAAVATVCMQGGHFATANADELNRIDARLEPVYASLQNDPFTLKLINQIKALKPATFPAEYVIDEPGCLLP